VRHGESYEDNAAREIVEEAGVQVDALEPLFTFYYDGIVRVWGRAFRAYFDGDVGDLKP
jgi:8-oxo-dGTP pyrophosphatase MutT (NUDIX family)